MATRNRFFILHSSFFIFGVCILGAGCSAPAPQAATPQEPRQPPPKTAPDLPEIDRYRAAADEILRGRQIIIESAAQVATKMNKKSADPAFNLSAAVGKRRDVTLAAIEAFQQLSVPARLTEVHRLYLQLLQDDVHFNDQAAAAIRGEKLPEAVSISQKRDAHERQILKQIEEAYAQAGLQVVLLKR